MTADLESSNGQATSPASSYPAPPPLYKSVRCPKSRLSRRLTVPLPVFASDALACRSVGDQAKDELAFFHVLERLKVRPMNLTWQEKRWRLLWLLLCWARGPRLARSRRQHD